MWALIFLVLSGAGPANSSGVVPGFATEAYCTEAGNKLKIKLEGSQAKGAEFKSLLFACVKQN